MPYDVEAIKAKTDLLQLVEMDLGPPDKRNGRWYKWRCPFHLDKEPSLTVTPDNGQWYCFGCKRSGDVIAWLQERQNISFKEACQRLGSNGNGHWTEEERQAYLAELERRQREEEQKRKNAIAHMSNQLHVAWDYHSKMIDRSHWYSQGLTDETINTFGLGYCESCPTYPPSPSWTIPVLYKGQLLNIRHRLAQPPSPGDKYRPHIKNVPATLFNADILLQRNNFVILVEGEVKTIVLSQMGFQAVGIPGNTIFPERWARWFSHQPIVYVTLDPNANGQATYICNLLGSRGRLVSLPTKPDDFSVLYGGTKSNFMRFLELGRRLA